MFGEYVMAKKYEKEEIFQLHENDPTWHLPALGSIEPHSLHPAKVLIKNRKKKHKNDPLQDYIRRTPLTDDNTATEENLAHELLRFAD
mmetsp:Transcript_8147/g.16027  ORF Transcript_8147/g.16027 Transcript_8147/m.16027 type:complete len:88 (+) Transcript_8147:2322-2585(+)